MKKTSPLANLIKQPLLLGGLISSLLLGSPVASAQQPPRQKLTAPEDKLNKQETGPIAGGGGFICTTSVRVLNGAKQQLAIQIRKSSNIVFSSLPQDWTRERILKLVENVRLDEDKFDEKPTSRHNRKLRFTYGVDQQGEYVEALEPFCFTYEGTPIDAVRYDKLNAIYKQIQIEIMHEIAHHMKIGTSKETDKDARAFAKQFIDGINDSFVFCEFPRLTEEDKKEALPNVPAAMIDKKIVLANVTGQRLEFYDVTLSDKISLDLLQTDHDNLISDSLHALFSYKLKKEDATPLIGASTSQFVQSFNHGQTLTVQVMGELLDNNNIYTATLTLMNSKTNAWKASTGGCKIIAKPIQMARGAK